MCQHTPFKVNDVVVRVKYDVGLVIVGNKYVVREVDDTMLFLCGFGTPFAAENFELYKKEEVVKPSWLEDVPPTPPSKKIKKGAVWYSTRQYPELSIGRDWSVGSESITLSINNQSSSFNQEGLRKFAKELNLLADTMDEIQKGS